MGILLVGSLSSFSLAEGIGSGLPPYYTPDSTSENDSTNSIVPAEDPALDGTTGDASLLSIAVVYDLLWLSMSI
jgi:hypothetical protein